MQPTYIQSRTLDKTYGFIIKEELNKFKHNYPDYNIKNINIESINNKKYINNIFYPIIKKFDRIRIDDKPKVRFIEPINKNINIIEIILYETELINEPIIINDNNCKLLIKQKCELPNDWQKKCNSVPVLFYFNDTQIRIFIDIPGMKYEEISLNFKFQ